MPPKSITGAVAALITPYDRTGEIDAGALAALIEAQLAHGLAGFLLAGSTGEGLLLSPDERRRLCSSAVKAARGRGVVVVHVAAPATHEAVALAKHAEDAGADAIAAIPPIYYPNDTGGIAAYYEALAAAVAIPLYAYHVPSHTGVVLYRDVMRRLAGVPNLAGMKFTDANLDEMHHITHALGVPVLYGRDEMLAAGLLMGAVGGVGSTYNLMPGVYAEMCARAARGDWSRARELQGQANRVIEVLKRFGVFPAIKVALNAAGYAVGSCRAPVQPLKGSARELLAELDEAGIGDVSGALRAGA